MSLTNATRLSIGSSSCLGDWKSVAGKAPKRRQSQALFPCCAMGGEKQQPFCGAILLTWMSELLEVPCVIHHWTILTNPLFK